MLSKQRMSKPISEKNPTGRKKTFMTWMMTINLQNEVFGFKEFLPLNFPGHLGSCSRYRGRGTRGCPLEARLCKAKAYLAIG